MVGLVDLWLPMLVGAAVVVLAAFGLNRFWPVPGEVRVSGANATWLAGFFVYALVAALFVAYVSGRTLPPGAAYKAVFRIAGTVGVLAFAFGHIGAAVRAARTWPAATRETVHGVVYGLLMAGAFGWLWPDL